MQSKDFPQTNWTRLLEVAGPDPVAARKAFEELCAEYRDAIVTWITRRGIQPHDAEDAAHDFLARWLAKANPLGSFERRDRRFRDFLSVCLRNYLRDWLNQRRDPEVHEDCVCVRGQPPEVDDAQLFRQLDLAIAQKIHRSSLYELRDRMSARLSFQRFQRLQSVALGGVINPGYTALAKEFEVSTGTLKSWIFRFRRDYYDAFRARLSRLVDSSMVEDELQYLIGLIQSSDVVKTDLGPECP